MVATVEERNTQMHELQDALMEEKERRRNAERKLRATQVEADEVVKEAVAAAEEAQAVASFS